MLKLSSKTYKKLINEASLLAKAKEWEHLKVWFSYWKDDDEMIYKCLIWGRFFLDNYFRDKSPDFHLEIIKRFFSDKNEYGAYPRGFAKTTLVQLCISFSVCNNLDEFIVLIEKTFTEASEVLSAVRDEFANNAAVLQVYGNMIKADKKGLETDKAKDTQGDVLINGVRLRAKGFNSPIRGLKSKEWRPTRIILDDIEQDDHINNIEQRQKYLDNFIKGVLPALEIGKTIKMFGTILHNDSLLMNLINEHKGLILKAYDKEDPENTLLWPERWSYPILEKKKVDMMMEGKGCNPYEAPVLMSDFTYKPIGKIKKGDEVVGFTFDNGNRRKIVKSKILEVYKRNSDLASIYLSNGDKIRCTEDHRWFTGRFNKEEGRSPYLQARVGSKLMKVLSIPKKLTLQEKLDYRYLAGMIDGEGACKYGSIQIAQSFKHNPAVFNEIKNVLERLDIPYKISPCVKTKTVETFVINGGKDTKAKILWYGKPAKKQQILDTIYKRPTAFIREKPKVLKIEKDGNGEVYALKTETGNYVVWGYASSNSSKFYQEFLNEALDDENRRFIWEWLQSSYATEDLKYKSTSRYVTIDPAESKKDGADWTAVTIVDWDSDNNWYIDYAKRYRVNSAELIDLIFTLWQEFKPSRIGIEKKAFEDQIKPYLNVKKSELGVFPIVVELEPHGIRKEDRIVGALQGRFESKKIHFKSGSNDDQKILKSELYDFPRAKNDDLCLSGDTLVVTINGNKKIKDIKIGDKVLTPTGVKKVLWSGCTGKKKVITNLGIIGTAEHKIFNGKSFDKLDTLTYNNHISEFNLLNQIIWKYKKLLYLMEFPTNLWVGRESIILVNQQLIKEEKILKDFMLQFGNFIIERKFQKGMLFTIKTVILLITTLITWNVYLMGNIYQSIGKKIAVIQNFLKRIKNIWKRYDHLQKNGINLKKEESGIEKNQKNNGLILNLQNWFVKNVKRVLPVLNLTQDSAIIIARCGIGEKGIQKNGIRLIREVLTREKVYNITVEDDGVFYANGILVSNCDALAYIEQLGSRPYSKDKKIPTSIAEEMKAVRGDERANNLNFLP